MKLDEITSKQLIGTYSNHIVKLNGTPFRMVLPFGEAIRCSNFDGTIYSAKMTNNGQLFTVTLTYHADLKTWFGCIYENSDQNGIYKSMKTIISVEF